MALYYKNQSRQEALARKNPLTAANGGYRLGDLSSVLFGNRGNDYDELQYLRNKNTDATAVNAKKGDAWIKFAPANGTAGNNRADQTEREFYQEGTYV